MNQQGFHIVGYGCTTCIGNSGDLDESVASAISENGIVGVLYHTMSVLDQFSSSGIFLFYVFCCILTYMLDLVFPADIVAAAVLSGNRNFEGRVHALTRANYLASPPLVVAYALAGTVML